MKGGSALLNGLLANAGLGPQRARRRDRREPHARAEAAPKVNVTDCIAHNFERKAGGSRCRHCGAKPAHLAGRRARRAVEGRVLEKDVQRQIMLLLTKIGCRYSATEDTDIWVLGTKRPRNLPGAAHRTYQTPGIPDLYVHLPARRPGPWSAVIPAPPAIWIEVKAEGGKPSEAQLRFAKNCADRAIPHLIGGLQDVADFLLAHGFLREG